MDYSPGVQACLQHYELVNRELNAKNAQLLQDLAHIGHQKAKLIAENQELSRLAVNLHKRLQMVSVTGNAQAKEVTDLKQQVRRLSEDKSRLIQLTSEFLAGGPPAFEHMYRKLELELQQV